MFNIFKSTKPKYANFSFLKTDVHSHFIPGIDDGAKTVEDSVALIKGLIELGYEKIITTPHIISDLYPNTPEIIKTGLEKVKTALKAENIHIEIQAAAEYMLDEGFDKILDEKNALTFGKNYLLFETSMISKFPGMEDYVFKMRTKGYTPVFAHPERYLYFRENLDQYVRLKDMGCLFQMNILSLYGYYGAEVKKLALKLLGEGMIDFLGSDMHHTRHLENMKKVLEDKKVNALLAEHTFSNASL